MEEFNILHLGQQRLHLQPRVQQQSEMCKKLAAGTDDCVDDGVNVLKFGQQRLDLQQKVCAATEYGGLKSVAACTDECST
jgi:hypothetical protein